MSADAHPKYRPDIDGLRAIAVVSVVGYHAAPQWFPGGFIGVDIFFVISGYLISSIIFGGLDAGSFSFADFYARRVRRIFPALLLVLAASYAVGWFWLFDDEYKQLGYHIAAGAGFVSNIALLGERGYFDNAADTKPLLHLWSLGVEEQFYIAWPALMWLALRARVNRPALIAVIATASFALNIYESTIDAAMDFYSPLTRFWELLTGAALLFATTRPTVGANARAWAGMALFVAGFALVNNERAFPGAWALLPVLGAAALISAGPQAWLNRVALSSRPLVWVGLISYPLYLWHWPLLTFARIVEGGAPPLATRFGLVALSVALAWLTYRLLERPVRDAKFATPKTLALVVLMIGAGYAGYNCYARDGLGFRGPSASALHSGRDGGDMGVSENGCGLTRAGDAGLFATCVHDRRGPARFALLGDSKADALHSGLMRTSTEQGRWLFIGGGNLNGAPEPVLSSQPIYAQFQTVAVAALDALAANREIEVVAIDSATRILFHLSTVATISDLPENPNYDIAFAGLSAGVGRLVDAGKKVVLIVDNPTLLDPKECAPRTHAGGAVAEDAGKCDIRLSDHLRWSAQYRRLLAAVAATRPGDVVVFDPTSVLCDEARDLCPMFRNGRILYAATDHISDYASGLIGARLNAFMLETFGASRR